MKMEKQSLNEDVYNAALKHALADIAEEQDLEDSALLDQYINTPECYVSESCKRNITYLLQQSRKEKGTHKNTFGKKTAILVAAICAFMFTLAAQASFFNPIDWVFNYNNAYTSMEVIGHMERKCVVKIFGHSNWEQFCFPENIPEGFILESVKINNKKCHFIFTKGESAIELRQVPLDSHLPEFSTTYDNEKLTRGQRVTINGINAFWIEKKGKDIVSFNDNNFYFEFCFTNVSKTDISKICSNLKLITK